MNPETIAARWRVSPRTGVAYCNCDEAKMKQCHFYRAHKLEGMCEHNFSAHEPQEVTDECYHPEARKIARETQAKPWPVA